MALDAVVLMVRTTSLCALLTGSVAGAKEHAAWDGRFEQARVSAVVIPGLGVKVMCSIADCPAVTLTEASVGARPNPGSTTVTLAVACAEALYASTTVRVTAL